MTGAFFTTAGTAALFMAVLIGTSACSEPRESPASNGAEQGTEAPKEAPPPTQKELEDLYRGVKQRFETGAKFPPGAGDANFAEVERDLRLVSARAEDIHLRANAGLLLGSLFEARGDRRSAISFYRQAQMALPEEPSPRAVLAMALAADKQWPLAVQEQLALVKMIPDDLQAWLILGEIQMKSGDEEAAAKAYAAYEMRRKGLLDGLTLTEAGRYLSDPRERAQCANMLAPAGDNGTALALMTAYKMEPEVSVRLEIVGAMGAQRLSGYRGFLEEAVKTAAKEQAGAELQDALAWALAEVERDPVESRPGALPTDATPTPGSAPVDP